MKKISIIMSTYNERIEDVRLAVESILNQTYNDFEFIIVVDLPENEEIINVLKKYKEKDERIILIINKKNIGLPNSLNKGLKIATGEYIARMDADDISFPERLENQVKYLDKNEDIVLIGTLAKKIDENNNEIGCLKVPVGEQVKTTLKYRCCLVHPSIMFKKEILKKISGYRNFPCAQDYDFYSRIIDYGYKIDNLNEYYLKYRISNRSISGKKRLFQILLSEYIQNLSKERKKNGIDSFTEDKIKEIEAKYLVENLKFQTINKVVEKNKNNKFKLIVILPYVYIMSRYYRKEINNRIKIYIDMWRKK